MKKIILILFLTFVFTEYNNPNGKPGLLTVSFNVQIEHQPSYTGHILLMTLSQQLYCPLIHI